MAATAQQFECARCGREADVMVVNRETHQIYAYSCEGCAVHALRAGPHIDYPLDLPDRNARANAALNDYYMDGWGRERY